MAFLLVEILLLVLLGAAAGAGIAWWWARRSFADVTSEYDLLQQRAQLLDGQQPVLDGLGRRLAEIERLLGEQPAVAARLAEVDRKIDGWSVAGVEGQNRLSDGLASLAGRFAAYRVDLGPIEQRLDRLEQRLDAPREPAAEALVLLDRLAAMEDQLAEIRPRDLERVVAASSAAVAGRIDGLERRVVELGSAYDASAAPVLGRLDDIEAWVAAIPGPVDPAPLHERLGRLDEAVARVEHGLSTRPAGSSEGEQALASHLAGIESHTSALDERLGTMTSSLQGLGALDVAGLVPRFEAVRARLDALQTPDVTDLSAGVAALTATVASLRVPNFEQLGQRLAAIERRLDGGPPAGCEIGAVVERLRSLEERLTSAPPPPASVAAPAARPLANGDPLATLRREPGRNLLRAPAFGAPDNLEIVRGIGPKLTELLHQLGVFYFWQVAQWTEDDITFVDGQLEQFQGRIERDQWVTQCATLAREPGAAVPPS